MQRTLVRSLLVCGFFSIGFILVSRLAPVHAGRTCCELPGNDPTKCIACSNDTYYKNEGDDCGSDPTCQNCKSPHPVANACTAPAPSTGCRYFSFAPNFVTLEEGQSTTVISNVFADSTLMGSIRYSSRDVTVATLTASRLARYIRNVCCGWSYGYYPGGLALRINAEKPGRTTILGEALTSASTTSCATAVMTVVVTAKATPTPSPTPSPTPIPTPTPPGCSCGAWVRGACNMGGCAVGSYPETRSCTPTACAQVSRCVTSAACLPTPSPTPSPTPITLGTIVSRIETDPSLSGGVPPTLIGGILDPYCSSPSTGTPFSAGSIAARNSLTGTNYPGTISNGTYTIRNLPGANAAYCVSFTPSSPNIVCTCPVGCQYCGKTVPTTQDLKFYVSPVGNSWYQTIGGEVGAQSASGVSLGNQIPATCIEPFCRPFLSLPMASESRSIGALITTRAGSVNLLSGRVGKSPNDRHVRLTSPLVCRENYDYFYRLYSMGLSPTSDFQTPADARKPTAAPGEGRAAYFHGGGSNLRITSPWVVGPGESLVVFVKGNLQIANSIKVASGGFVAFIVSGTIEVDPSVGTTDHASVSDGQVQGVYIANNSIRVLGATGTAIEKKLVAEGTFAACNGIKIDRDYSRGGAGLDNNTLPAVVFLYRPDFVKHTPERMKTSNYVWREVSP